MYFGDSDFAFCKNNKVFYINDFAEESPNPNSWLRFSVEEPPIVPVIAKAAFFEKIYWKFDQISYHRSPRGAR